MNFCEKHANTVVSSAFITAHRPRASKGVSGCSYLLLDKSKLKHPVLSTKTSLLSLNCNHNTCPEEREKITKNRRLQWRYSNSGSDSVSAVGCALAQNSTISINISTCWRFRVTYRRGLECMIRFIDTLYIQLGIKRSYSAIADLHTLQFTVTHALVFSVFTSHILTTDL
jgi:hypothetical protein